MSLRKKLLAIVALSVPATLASSAVSRVVSVAYPGTMDCERGCSFAAGGWPFAYVIDHPGISPTGSVSLINGFLGVDIIWPGHMLATFAFWFVLFTAIVAIAGRLHRPH